MLKIICFGLLMRRFGIFASLFCAFWLNACADRHYNQRVSEAGFQGNLRRILIIDTIEPGVAPITVTSFREEIGRTLGACGIETSDLSLHRMMLNQRETVSAATAPFRPDLILSMSVTGTVLSWPSPELVVQVSVAPPGGQPFFKSPTLFLNPIVRRSVRAWQKKPSASARKRFSVLVPCQHQELRRVTLLS